MCLTDRSFRNIRANRSIVTGSHELKERLNVRLGCIETEGGRKHQCRSVLFIKAIKKIALLSTGLGRQETGD